MPHTDPLTGEQLRGARAMLRMQQTDLAQRVGVHPGTLKRLEKQTGPLRSHYETAHALQRALEAAGVEFLEGGGVRLRQAPTFEDVAGELLAEVMASTPDPDGPDHHTALKVAHEAYSLACQRAPANPLPEAHRILQDREVCA